MMTLIFLLTLTSIYLFYSRFRTAEASDTWFNDLWKKRQKIQVTNISNARIDNFIVEASLPGSTLINSGFLNSNCSDIRVIDSTLSVLNHWVDPETCNTSQTKIYFKVPTLYNIDDGNSGVNTFYIYYGNSDATLFTVAQTTLFVATIPNLKANYNFESIYNNVVTDNSGLENHATLVNTSSTTPGGAAINNLSTFPEGYSKKAFYFNGYNVFVSTPIKMTALTKAYTLLTFIKPEGTRANGYMVQQESMGKMFNFENINKGGANPCLANEYQEGDGVSSCVANGLSYAPDTPTQKKTGSNTYYYDFYWNRNTRPSLSVTFNGSSQYLFAENPVNFTPLLTTYKDYGYFYKIKPYGEPGEVRTIHSWGNTSPGNYSYTLDYSVCSDGSLRFSLDYENSRNDSATLATPCLNSISPSSRISSNAGKYAIYANGNKWINLATVHFENKRYIFVNGVLMAQDNTAGVFIERQNVRAYLGRAANSNKSNFKGEIDEFNNFGADLSWFRGAYYTGGVFNTSIEQLVNNLHKKSYVIFGNNSNDFFQAGFSNHANSRYPTATAMSNFNYNFNTSDTNDFYQQYGGNLDNTLNIKTSYISATHNLFNGNWYRYYTQFDDTRNSIASNYLYGSTTYSYEQGYRNTNANGVLTIGAYVNSNEDTASYPSEFFLGGIDDVFVYSETLSATQLTYHSSPWNGYASYGKTLWQSDLPSSARGTISFSQSFAEESQSFTWYDRNYPFRVQVNVFSLPVITVPNFQVNFNFDTSTPISNQRINSDCSGIIVTDDFNRSLPYWIENCNSTSSKFYVKMNPDSSSNANSTYSIKGGSNQNLYVYYGNEKSTAKTYPPSQVFDYEISGLEVAYNFEDNSASQAFDKSGNGKTMSLSNITSATGGAYGKATFHNGGSSLTSFPNTASTVRNSWSGITSLTWFKNQDSTLGANYSVLLLQLSQPAPTSVVSDRYQLWQSGPVMAVRLYGATDIFTSPSLDTKYNFVGTSWDFGSTGTVKFVYNNYLNSTPNSSNYESFPNTGNSYCVGNSNCVNWFGGWQQETFSGPIDEFRLFNRQLTDTELRAYTINTTLGSSALDLTENTCNQVNNYCMKSYVTPSYPGYDLLGKYNSNVVITTNAEMGINTPYIYFKFNEGKGLSVNDSANKISSSSLGDIRFNNILTGNEPSWSREENCVQGECLYFDGMNDFVDVATIPGGYADTFLTYNSNYSYSFWVKPLSNPNSRHTIISFGQSANGLEGYTLYLDNKMRLYNYGSRAGTIINSSASTLPINKWTHVTFVYNIDSSLNKFYINGNLDSTHTIPAACVPGYCAGTTMSVIHIGANASGKDADDDYFKGYLDEFKIYKTNLNDSDILEDYRKGLNNLKYNLVVDQDTLTKFNLVAYYPFDEMDRSVAFDYSNIGGEARYPNTLINNSPGIFNNAFSNPGNIAETFSIPNSNYVNLNAQATYSFWVNINSVTGTENYLLYKAGTGGFNVKFINSSKKYSATICGVTIETPDSYSIGQWDHIILTANSKRAKLYVNSTLVDEDYCFNSYVGDQTNTNPIRVGGDGTVAGASNSLIDDFRIYDNYLSNNQAQLLFSYKPIYPGYGNNATAFYKLDDSDGTTTAVDASGNNNNLSMFVPATNQNSWNTFGKIGNSYDFTTNASGTKNLFSVASSTMTTNLTQPFTFTGWVAFSEPFYGSYALTQVPCIFYVGPTDAVGYRYAVLNVEPISKRILNVSTFFYNSDAERIYFSSPYLNLTIGAKNPIWYHVAGTYDGYLRKLYVNGELVKVDTNTSTTVSIGGSSIVLGGIGGNNSNSQFQYNGMLDEAKIYNYARTQDQVKMDMRNSDTAPALSADFYSNIRTSSIQKPSSLNTSGDATIYPLIDINFDTYFKTDSILLSNTPVILDEITFNSVPGNVSNYQLQFTIPISTYTAKHFSHASCSNFILTDEKGRRIPYWAEPDSCRIGTASVIAKFPTTNNSQYLKVSMDPYKTSTNVPRNYSNKVEDIFDYIIPDLVLAHNFEETSGDVSYDSSGYENHIQWVSRDNVSTGAYGRAPYFDGTNDYGTMPFFTTEVRSQWPGFSFFGWIWAASSKTMNVIDFIRKTNSSYFVYGRFWDSGISTNYQKIAAFGTTHIDANNNGTEYLFRGFTAEFSGPTTSWIKMYDDGALAFQASTGRVGNSFPNTYDVACLGRLGSNTTGLCTTNSEGWLGSFDQIRGFSRVLSLTEYQAYMKNSTNSYTPLGNSGVIGRGVADPDNPCNLSQGWCTKSFVTPSYPGTDLLGKFNNKVFAVHKKVDQPVFSLANSGVEFADGEGVRGGAAYFFTAGDEVNMSISSNRFNFTQGSDAAISFYINPSNTSLGSIASSTGLKINKLSGNQVQFSGSQFNLISSRTIPANSWSHVFFQKNGQSGVFELYIDNQLQETAYHQLNSLNISDLKFTLTESTTYLLDELKIYNNVLTSTLITNLYKNGGFGLKMGSESSTSCVDGSSAFCSAPVDEFLFDETSGTTAFNTKRNRSSIDIGITGLRAKGYTGQAIRFEGNTTLSTNLIMTNTQASFSFWYKAQGTGGIFDADGFRLNNIISGNIEIPGEGIKLRSEFTGSYWGDFQKGGPRDPWHHISVNYNTFVSPATYDLYLDGVYLLSGTFTKSIGSEIWMLNSTGLLDNLRFYNYQRDSSQVAQEYSRGKPFSYFKLDECTGTKLYNSNSNIYLPLQVKENGTRTDAQAFLNTGLNLTNPVGSLNFNSYLCREGKYNKSIYFDSNVYMQGNDYHSRVFNSEGNATITFWINPDNNTAQNVNLIGSLDGTNSHLIKLINNDISLYLHKSGTSTLKLNGTTDISNNSWTHVAVVFESGANYKLYLNGNLEASANNSFESVLNTCTGGRPVVCTNNPFIVGKGFTGRLDEVKVYNFPLNQSQIKIDMNQNSAIRIE